MPDIHSSGLGSVAWDGSALPQRWWDSAYRLPNGCWVAIREVLNLDIPVDLPATNGEGRDRRMSARNMRRMAVDKLGIDGGQPTFTVPTCGDSRCANPAHLCVTYRTELTK